MNNQRGQRIVRGQRFSASDILQVKGRAVRHPEAGLLRSVIPSGGEEWAIRAANVNLDGDCVGRFQLERVIPTRRPWALKGVGSRLRDAPCPVPAGTSPKSVSTGN